MVTQQNNLQAQLNNLQNLYNSQHGNVTNLSNQTNETRRVTDQEIQQLRDQLHAIKVSLGMA